MILTTIKIGHLCGSKTFLEGSEGVEQLADDGPERLAGAGASLAQERLQALS